MRSIVLLFAVLLSSSITFANCDLLLQNNSDGQAILNGASDVLSKKGYIIQFVSAANTDVEFAIQKIPNGKYGLIIASASAVGFDETIQLLKKQAGELTLVSEATGRSYAFGGATRTANALIEAVNKIPACQE